MIVNKYFILYPKITGTAMKDNKTSSAKELAGQMAELTCEVARTCNHKENHFASMFNLTTAELRCLLLFKNEVSLTLKQINELMKVTPGRITHILTSLENKGFVKRKADTKDKRNVIVRLTAKSKPFIKNINESHIDIHEKILDKIEPDKRHLVLDAMEEVIRALKLWSQEN